MTGISCLSGKQKLFPGFPCLCHISPHILFSWQLTPVVSLGSDLQSLSLNIQSPAASSGMQTNISGWGMLVGTNLCVEFSILFPLHNCCCTLLWGSEAPYCLHKWGGVWMYGKLSSFTASSQKHRSHHDSFLSLTLFHYFFCPTPLWGNQLTFLEVCGLLPVFSWCYVVASNTDVFLMYLWGWKVITRSYSSVILEVPPHHNTSLVYPFICWWTLRWLSYLVNCK